MGINNDSVRKVAKTLLCVRVEKKMTMTMMKIYADDDAMLYVFWSHSQS
jgi:hypothetical protein